MNISLKEYKKHDLVISVKPKNAEIILENAVTKDRFYLKSGLKQSLYEGSYNYIINKKKYKQIENKEKLFLIEDKSLSFNMLDYYASTLKTYTIISTLASSSSANLNLGLALNLLEVTEDILLLTLGGAFFRDILNYNNYFKGFIELKFKVFKELRLGGGVSIFADKDTSIFMFGFIGEYNYKISENFFIQPKLDILFNFSELKFMGINEQVIFTGGISFGWNGF